MQPHATATQRGVGSVAISHGAAWALSSYCLVLAGSGSAHGASSRTILGWTSLGAVAFFACGRIADTGGNRRTSIGWAMAFAVAATVFWWWPRWLSLLGVDEGVNPFPRLVVTLIIFGGGVGMTSAAATTWSKSWLTVPLWAVTSLVAGAIWRVFGYILAGVMGAVTGSESYGAAVGVSVAAGICGYLSALVALSIVRLSGGSGVRNS